MRVAIVGYRDWATRLYGRISEFRHELSFYEELPPPDQADIVFLVGWSEIVPETYFTAVPCYVLHPSDLPLYRGGSPIQHQMIEGEQESKVSIFRLLPGYGIDAGPLAAQEPYHIGNQYLSGVLDNIVWAGARAIASLLNGADKPEQIVTWEQPPVPLGHPPVWKRRTPFQSEINAMSLWIGGDYVGRMVRALQPPYPEAYIHFSNGKLIIESVRWEPNE